MKSRTIFRHCYIDIDFHVKIDVLPNCIFISIPVSTLLLPTLNTWWFTKICQRCLFQNRKMIFFLNLTNIVTFPNNISTKVTKVQICSICKQFEKTKFKLRYPQLLLFHITPSKYNVSACCDFLSFFVQCKNISVIIQ